MPMLNVAKEEKNFTTEDTESTENKKWGQQEMGT